MILYVVSKAIYLIWLCKLYGGGHTIEKKKNIRKSTFVIFNTS